MTEMKRIAILFVLLALASPRGPVSARPAADRLVFALVVTRHGVRSATKAPAPYAWAGWSPVQRGFLTRRGYRLMTYMGRWYGSYFAARGLRSACTSGGAYVYADRDQRTLETARALVEGACGSSGSILVHHAANMEAPDPLFDGSDWLGPAGKIDAAASLRAVTAEAPHPPSAIVSQHAEDFAGLQQLLDDRCPGTCAPLGSGTSTIVARGGLAKLTGPLTEASSDAESLFLEYAQCRPRSEFGKGDPRALVAELQSAMRLHVLAYDVNSRTSYNAQVRGGNIFAHAVALLEEKAGGVHPYADAPRLGSSTVAFIVGHDTELGALGGILAAHWSPEGGIVPDDMPPGSALIFELYRTSAGEYRVDLRFASQTLTQFRSNADLANGAHAVPVRFAGCTGTNCSAPLAHLAAIASALASRGFVKRSWTPNTTAPVREPPLADTSWTHCMR
jgi:4-phytase/acid phosphatase